MGELDLAAFIACGGLAAGAELSPPPQQTGGRLLQPQHVGHRYSGCRVPYSTDDAADWSTSRAARSPQPAPSPLRLSRRDPRMQHAASQDGIRYGVGGGTANPHSPCSSRALSQCVDALGTPGHPGATPGFCQGLGAAEALSVDIDIVTDGGFDDGFSLGRAGTCMSGANIAGSDSELLPCNWPHCCVDSP